MSSEEIPSLLVIGRAHFSHWLHNFCVDKREEEGKPGEIFMFVLSLTFCHVSFSKKMWNEICQTSVRGPIGFGATSLTAFLIVVKCRGCREEQSGADTLRSVVGWVGIVNDWLLENEMKILKTGIVIYCTPKLFGTVRECCEDLHAGFLDNKTSVCFSCFHVSGQTETHRDVVKQTERN